MKHGFLKERDDKEDSMTMNVSKVVKNQKKIQQFFNEKIEIRERIPRERVFDRNRQRTIEIEPHYQGHWHIVS